MDTTGLSGENNEVDKSLFDAEQFLSNYTSLREECDRLKTDNHQYQMRIQQLSQDLNQAQVDKQNLERHIQKENLRNKEIIWNLKLEIQKSQEDRLSWKEKYLDLCIKASQDKTKDISMVKDAAVELVNDRKDKRFTKKNKKKPARKRLKIDADDDKTVTKDASLAEQKQRPEQQSDTSTPQDKVIELQQVQQQPADTQPGDLVSHQSTSISVPPHTTNDKQATKQAVLQAVEPLSLTAPLTDETSNMPTADMVTSLDANLNSSADLTQGHVVTTGAADYYGLPTAPFDLNTQAESVSGTTTFILQTTDATFCATAVLDDQQRNSFANGSFSIKSDSNAYNSNASFDDNLDDDTGSDSEENTEFNFRCNLCNFTYSDQEGLQKHIKAKHAAKTCFCKQCGKAYSTKSSLAQHVHHYHRHPLAYSCNMCDKKFNRKDFLIKHQKSHSDDRTFQCSHCDKQFKTSASLSAHVNGAHNEARRFVCDFCGMRTSWRLSHLEHMKLHTGEPRRTRRGRKQHMQDDIEQLQHQQLQHQTELQQIQTQELQQLVVEPTSGTVVQFITTTNA